MKGFRWAGGSEKPVRKDLGVGGWGSSNPFTERIEKPIRKIGPPLNQIHEWLTKDDTLRMACCITYVHIVLLGPRDASISESQE